MVRTFLVLLVLLAGLLFVLVVVVDDTPKKRIALHEPLMLHIMPYGVFE